MILTPLVDIDNLNLAKFEHLWSLMTKGERNKDKGERETKIGERYEKGKGSTKILSTQVGGASS